MEERLKERTRIARDLHDTFLQSIQGSKLVADDALSATTDLSRMRQAMEKLSAWLGRATEEGRAALNSLRTSTTEVNDLADAFRRALEEARASIPISYIVASKGTSVCKARANVLPASWANSQSRAPPVPVR
jgi:signal transduction histidine kinase